MEMGLVCSGSRIVDPPAYHRLCCRALPGHGRRTQVHGTEQAQAGKL